MEKKDPVESYLEMIKFPNNANVNNHNPSESQESDSRENQENHSAENQENSSNKTQDESGSLKDAFDFANSCRDNEIDRFWSRGTYFWGFIAASFGAYMVVFSASLKDGEKISLPNIIAMSFISKTALLVLSFICFVFCFSWMVAHKGSKFWQRNWETHISYLGSKHIGNIYTTWLNTKANGCEKNPFSSKAYDYSVSKISYLDSLLLTFCSLLFVLFNVAVMVMSFLPDFNDKIKEKSDTLTCVEIIVFAVLVFLMIIFVVHFFRVCLGNKDRKKKKMEIKREKVSFGDAELKNCEKE